jgi:hypothetical protein
VSNFTGRALAARARAHLGVWSLAAINGGVVRRSAAGVSAIPAGAAQLNRPASTMIGPGQLPLDPPVVLLFQDPQPDLALN